MKLLILSCVLIGVLAEPPRYRSRVRFQRIELAPTTDSPAEPTTESGPYAPSGWKPAGEPFVLPKQELQPTYGPPAHSDGPYPPSGWRPDGEALMLPKQQAPPSTSYGVPDDSYTAPANTYGAPSTDSTTTDNPQAEKLDGPVEVQKSMGAYYVLLPTGQLQRVEFVTENDVQNMKYTARLQLANPAPLFVFGP